NKTFLIEIILETVILKQFSVIRRIVIHVIQRRVKSFNQQSPPLVTFAQIDRSVHGFHILLLQPVFGGIKQQISYFLIINRFKKTNSTRRLFFLVFGIDKSSNSAYNCLILFDNPAFEQTAFL